MNSVSYHFFGHPQNFASRKETSHFLASLYTDIPVVQPLQVHGKNIVEITQENISSPIEADGVWTSLPKVLLSVKTADCIGLLFSHKEKQIVGAIHAGWRGLAQKISTEFLKQFSTSVCQGFQVFLSPSLGVCCAEFSDPFHETPAFFHPFITVQNKKVFVDLWKIATNELQECGILEENISLPASCTKCSQGKWWSHRNGNTERNISIIGQGI